jgi:hypothetical protein
MRLPSPSRRPSSASRRRSARMPAEHRGLQSCKEAGAKCSDQRCERVNALSQRQSEPDAGRRGARNREPHLLSFHVDRVKERRGGNLGGVYTKAASRSMWSAKQNASHNSRCLRRVYRGHSGSIAMVGNRVGTPEARLWRTAHASRLFHPASVLEPPVGFW